MAKPKIGIIISMTREGRFGETPARWILDMASKHDGLDFETIDLRDYPLPHHEKGIPRPAMVCRPRVHSRRRPFSDAFLALIAALGLQGSIKANKQGEQSGKEKSR